MRHPHFVSTRKFNRVEEGTTTGADWLWLIGRPGRWLPLILQAKIVDTRTGKCMGFRQKLSGGGLQYDLFVQYAKQQRLYPLYCIYNWASDPALPLLKSACLEGDNRTHLGCLILLPGNVAAFNRRRLHARHEEILEQGHSLACLVREEHRLVHPAGLTSTWGLADTVAAAIDRYREGLPPDGLPLAADFISQSIPSVVVRCMSAQENIGVLHIRRLLVTSERELGPDFEITLGSHMD